MPADQAWAIGRAWVVTGPVAVIDRTLVEVTGQTSVATDQALEGGLGLAVIVQVIALEDPEIVR
jgi:hypothetical protein